MPLNWGKTRSICIQSSVGACGIGTIACYKVEAM
jgi:hypothetical protein